MSYMYQPDKELFEEGVLLVRDFDSKIKCELVGLYKTGNAKQIIPCIYKSILSFKNGFARVIDLAGRLIYVSEDGERLFDQELPFVRELCEDFDQEGNASIACLIEGVFVIKGHMNTDGEMLLEDYNEV